MNDEKFKQCVVFTHFGKGNRPGFTARDKASLKEEWQKRFERYNTCSKIVKHVFVFISEGYQALLAGQSEAPFISMDRDRILVKLVREAAKQAGCTDGFIIPIGFDRMVDVLRRLQLRAKQKAKRLSHLLLGEGQYMRYDAPKIVDAILRIAGRRTSPVFRLDEDVYPKKGSFQKLLRTYKKLPDNGELAFVAFSGGYGLWGLRR